MEKMDIIYDRKLSGSYMKIRVDSEGGFDEQMLMRQQIPGLLALEKCYVDGREQFWYDISGRQSLDTFCGVKAIGQAFLEQLVHSVCDEIGLLEKYLVDTNCLCLAPELVYVSIQTGELVFTAVPGKEGELTDCFRELIEYLLTRIDHKDERAVQLAYDIYEKTLDEGYSIADIQESIVLSRLAEAEKAHPTMESEDEIYTYQQMSSAEALKNMNINSSGWNEDSADAETSKVRGRRFDRMSEFADKHFAAWRAKLPSFGSASDRKRNSDEREWKMVYPDEKLEDELHEQMHPTICLSDFREHPEGLLLYEGYENFSNIRIANDPVRIGHSDDSDVVIAKETISRYHARIERVGHEFFLEDLNSTNGTFVNEKPLVYKEKRKLETNDIIRFADVKYRFV